MPYVPVPKDLTKVKTKLAFNLTKRQLICFSLAGLVGLPVYFFTRGAIGNSAAVLLMIGLMMPFFFFAMYERDGQPAEKILKNRLRYKLWPKDRPYRTDNLYKSMSKKEVTKIAKNKQQEAQEKRLQKNIRQAKKTRADAKQGKTKSARSKPSKKGGFFAGLKADAPQTVQQSIPYREMYRDGICRLTDTLYTKTVQFFDINYQLAQADDKAQIFEGYCDFLNYFDASIHVQLTFINQRANMQDFTRSIDIPPRGDEYDGIRREYGDMLKNQLQKGNNGLTKRKYITFGIEADDLRTAKMRLERIETDVLANFKTLGVQARSLNGLERLELLHSQLHPDGQEKFHFQWSDLPKTGLSTKDFISPSGLSFSKDGKTFRVGDHSGAVSFLQILAPELTDRLLADLLDLNDAVTVNLHIQSIDQAQAIRNIKRKMSDLQKMTIEEQKKAVRSGYDMDIIPTDLATYGEEAKNLLQDLQSRNERMFLVTVLVENIAAKRQKLFNDIFAASGVAQKYNCALNGWITNRNRGLCPRLLLARTRLKLSAGLRPAAQRSLYRLPPVNCSRRARRCITV